MRETKEMYPSWGDDHGVRLGNVKISDLHDFKEHPFHVVEDMALFELARSIEDKGVLVPLIVRANPYGEGYEIIAGHRRKAACKWAGLSEVPVMIVELDDNEAVIAMVDSNLQREHIKPSEKAFSYKMKLEAMKQQGKRTDLTSCQLGKKSVENPTLSLAKVGCGYDENGRWQVTNEEVEQKPIDSNKQLAIRKVEKMKAELSKVFRDDGYANVAEFFTVLFEVREEKRKYEEACKVWQEECVRAEISINREAFCNEEIARRSEKRHR